ncbi:hypothetical protein [Chitinophaga sp. RAB17]|uniref:hypothetical protein n=1 Tax=Chitinophaga sp. RAB17 TaxID=3233049 RepID=UPI003F8DE2D3
MSLDPRELAWIPSVSGTHSTGIHAGMCQRNAANQVQEQERVFTNSTIDIGAYIIASAI